jgi:hypothetical protein
LNNIIGELTEEEQEEVRRQQRRIKNRNSARLSRERKRSELEHLYWEVDNMNEINQQLSFETDVLKASAQLLLTERDTLQLENGNLRREVEVLKLQLASLYPIYTHDFS